METTETQKNHNLIAGSSQVGKEKGLLELVKSYKKPY